MFQNDQSVNPPISKLLMQAVILHDVLSVASKTSLFGRPNVIPQRIALTSDSVLHDRVLKPQTISNISVAQCGKSLRPHSAC